MSRHGIDVFEGTNGAKRGRTRATLKRKLLIRVAPYFMGCNATTAKLAPTLHVPSMVTPERAASGPSIAAASPSISHTTARSAAQI